MDEDFRLWWLKHFLLKYFQDNDERIFNRMLKRHNNKSKTDISNFFHISVQNSQDWRQMTLMFYKTKYEKTFYKWVYVTKKITRPVLQPPSSRSESPESPAKKTKPKAVKGKKGKEKNDSKDDSIDENPQDVDKKKKTIENKNRSQSPPTVIEMGPQVECEYIFQKVKILVKKKKTVQQLHCQMGPIVGNIEKYRNHILLFITRKTIHGIPHFDTYSEAIAEFPKYILVGTLNPEYEKCFKKQTKILINHVECSLTVPELLNVEFSQETKIKCRGYYKLKHLVLPYDSFFMNASNFYHKSLRESRKLYNECGKPLKIYTTFLNLVQQKDVAVKRYTLKTILCSPLYTMNEDLANIFYGIRQKKMIKDVDITEQLDQLIDSPIKYNMRNHLYSIIKKINWCLNHRESDIDIELPPWPGIEEIMMASRDELVIKKDLIDKMNKKLEILGKYVKNTLNKCRSKNPKGLGPVAEYQYWFKREDQLGPLVLTLYGRNISNILNLLNKAQSIELKDFLEKRRLLKQYYEISRDNRDYISVCIQCLEDINSAKDMDEVQKIIPQFWENLRYLWLLSGYWAVKSNIVGFIERVQYLIVKKSIKVLEVNHFFTVPQVISKQLAVDVINTMETWKNSFYKVKAYIETHQWEMRWEFPVHRIFTITDYMAKLAKDFCYLSDSLKQYFDIFGDEISKVVQDETVIETFLQRVKSLTIPIRTADFNIYDPDNDVHWNLLIESFARDLNSVEKESMLIINHSFKNLRSAVNATNILLKFKSSSTQDKTYSLLMKKFEFVNIQVIKEMKLINEFIMSHALVPPVLNYYSSHSGKIYWIRQLTTSFQFRYMYLKSIPEIRETKTQHQADECFKNFIIFYELYQLATFIDWIQLEKSSILNQLSNKIFKLTNVISRFKEDSYQHLFVKHPRKKITRKKQKALKLQFNKLKNPSNEENINLKRSNNIKKTVRNNKKQSVKTNLNGSKNKNSNEVEIRQINSANSSIKRYGKFPEIEQIILNLRRTLLCLLYEENQSLYCLREHENVSNFNKTNYMFVDSEIEKKESKTAEFHQQMVQIEALKNTLESSVLMIDNNKEELLKDERTVNEETIQIVPDRNQLRTCISKGINELFLPHICTQYGSVRRLDFLIEDIMDVAHKITKSYSSIPSHQLELICSDSLAFPFLFPLFVVDPSAFTSYQPYSEPSEYSISILSDLDNFNDSVEYTILNSVSLIKTSQETPVNKTERDYNEKNNIYSRLMDDQSGPSNSVKINKNTELVGSRIFRQILQKTNIKNGKEMNEASLIPNEEYPLEKTPNIPLHEYFSEHLFIEKGHLIDVKFDIKLFDVIMEIYHLTKLGYILPGEFYGLGLLNKRLRNDLKTLRKLVDQYNTLILSLLTSSLLSLKRFIQDFEYLLLKGLNYYSWHTTKVEHFCTVLEHKLRKVIHLNEDGKHLIRSIDHSIKTIKTIDWFNFNTMNSDFMGITEFFETLEERRNKAFNEMLMTFKALTPQLKKLEYLIFNEFSGENNYFVLCYKLYEENVLQALTQNFLFNMKKFKNFIAGCDDKKICLKLISIPDIVFNFNEYQCRFFFLNSVEKLLLRYKMIPRWKQGTCISVSWVNSNGEGIDEMYRQNYLEDIITMKSVATELIDIQQLIDTITSSVSSYLRRWQQYRILWDFDKEITIDNFFKNTSSLIERCDNLFCYFDLFIFELNSCKDYNTLYCMRVDLSEVRKTILSHALEWKNILKSKLTDLARHNSSRVHQKLSGIYDILTKNVQSLGDFQNLLKAIKDFGDFSCDYGASLSFISEIQYILARHGLRFLQEDRRIQREIQNMHSIIQKLIKYRTILINSSKKIYSKMSVERIKEFSKECRDFAEHYYLAGPGTVGDQLDRGYILLQNFSKVFKELNSRRENMIEAEKLFEQIPCHYEFFDKAYQESQLLEIVYELYQRQKDARSQWAKIPWIYLNSEELTTGINDFLYEFDSLPNTIKCLPVAQEVKVWMTNFKISIPLMMSLKNKALKERHWQELMSKTGHYFEMVSSKFLLQDLFCMNLYQHKDTVDDIIGKAIRELKIETSIKAMKEYWHSQKLKCVVYNNRLILKDTEDILISLDDYCIDLQRVANSQFAHPFLHDVNFWEKKLSFIRETIYNWTELQKNIMELSKILDDRKLQKLLPKALEIYNVFDKEYTKLMNSIQYKSNVLEQTVSSEINEIINSLYYEVENCKNVLSNYLTLIRNQFPRFYLLQDKELFCIMGSISLNTIQEFIPKVFCNLNSFQIKESRYKRGSKEITGLTSSENELFLFRSNVSVTGRISLWMKNIEEEMKLSSKYMVKMSIYNYATIIQSRVKWIYSHLSSSISAAIKVWWTAEVENLFSKISKGELQAMKEYSNVCQCRLQESLLEVKSSLTKDERMKFSNTILIDLHGRDVIENMASNSVISSTDFEWKCQIRFYWEKSMDTLTICQCLEKTEYGYEYMGIGNQLVITPLTERIYLALNQALSMKFGGALTGPHSTGKTETIKNLSKVFGILCLFFNCNEMMTNGVFKKIISALCQDGIWGCFDEFNLMKTSRLSVLGETFNTVRKAALCASTSFYLDGKEMLFNRNVALFITMNPGFAGNQLLPHRIRLLFRPISCILPCVEKICQVMLFAEGFSESKILSQKMAKLYELAKDQLSKQGCYDFGLRTMKSLLVVAGTLKRNAPDMEEKVVLMRALRDSNRSKFIPGDEVIFNMLVNDLFPGIHCPRILYPEFDQAVEKVWKNMSYVYLKDMAEKVTELYEILNLRHSAVIVGPTGGGKSLIINTLSQTQTILDNPSTIIKINPKALSVGELFGYFNHDTNNWFDGLFAKIFRENNKECDEKSKRYILFDGDMDSLWIENLNSIMDDSKQLTLPNSETISLQNGCYLLFETGHIQNLAPGVISRMGVMYVDAKINGYTPYWKRWILSRIDENEIVLLDRYFNKYVPHCLNLIFNGRHDDIKHPPLRTLIPQNELNMVVQLCFMIDALVPVEEKDNGNGFCYLVEKTNGDSEADSKKKVTQMNINKKCIPVETGIKKEDAKKNYEGLENIFIQALYLSLGASLSHEHLVVFDEFVKKISNFPIFADTRENKAAFGFLPTDKETLFEYCADKTSGYWIAWNDLVVPYEHKGSTLFDDIIVSTRDSCRTVWILNLINKLNCLDPHYNSYKYKMKAKKLAKRPVILFGEVNSSKTATLNEFGSKLDSDVFTQCSLGLSSLTSAKDLQNAFESNLERSSPYSLIPLNGKKLIMFIDDVNRPKADDFGTQQSAAFLKLLIENNGMYSSKDLKWRSIKDTYLFATMTISGSSFKQIDSRFLSLFCLCRIINPSDEIIHHIYYSVLKGHTWTFQENIKNISGDIITATIKIYKFASSKLLPTPSKFHYTFNLRDVSRIIKGLLQTSSSFYTKTQQFVRVWRNELTRVICDRLINEKDNSLIQNYITETINDFFPESIDYVMREPLLFGDYRNATQKGQSRDYEDLLDYEAVYHLFTEIIEEIRETNPKICLVLFESGLDHLTRIHRVLRMNRGHILIVGPVGCGKQTIVNLASYTADCKVYTIVQKRGYNITSFIKDIKKLLIQVGIDDQPTTFLLSSHQIMDEECMEMVNSILTMGCIKNVFSEEETYAIIKEYDIQCNKNEINKNNFWSAIESNCKKNLHITILMTEFDEKLRVICHKFPGILNNTTIDSMQTWPSEALTAIARRHLKYVDLIPGQYKEAVISTIVNVFEFTCKESKRINRNGLNSCITPKQYLDLIEVYVTMIHKNYEDNINKCNVLENVIQKVDDATQNILEMKDNIETQKSLVEEMKNSSAILLNEISVATENLNSKKKESIEKGQEIDTLNGELNQQMDDIQSVLTHALSEIDKAQEAIRDLSLDEINNISELESPTEMILIVFECVLILLDRSVLNWEEIKQVLNDPQFLSNIEEINLNSISVQQQKQVRARLKSIKKIQDLSEQGLTETSFLSLVEAILSYCSSLRETKPKQEKAYELEKGLSKAQNVMNGLNVEIQEIEKELKELDRKLTTAKFESEQAEAELHVTLQRLEAANKLIIGLDDDNTRWQKELNDLLKARSRIIGNCLVCASFLTCAGTFNWGERAILLSKFIEDIRVKRIPLSKPFQIENELVDEILLSKWSIELLPKTEWSIQNALLVNLSHKYPLCIDPKEQALEWIMRKEIDLTVLTLEDPNFNEEYENAIITGHTVIIKNAEDLNLTFFEVIELKSKAITCDLLDACGENINENVKQNVYMVTKLKCPNFDPMVFSQTTVINFDITLEELEESLLTIIIKNEHELIWEKLQNVNKSFYFNKINQNKLMKDLILKVDEINDCLLKKTETIEQLQDLKSSLCEIASKCTENEVHICEIETEMSIYRSIAKCGAILFFILSDLVFVNQLYPISLSLYKQFFVYSLKMFEFHPITEEHVKKVILYLKRTIYQYGCRGIFPCDKLLFSFKMATEFDKSNGFLAQKEILFFIHGSVEETNLNPSPFDWLSEKGWRDVHKLALEFPEDFHDIVDHMNNEAHEWMKWHELKGTTKCDFQFYKKLTSFKKLLLMRCLSFENLPNAVLLYIQETLGDEFIVPSSQSLDNIIEEGNQKVPIIFITCPGYDAFAKIMKLSYLHNMSNKLVSLAFGLGNSHVDAIEIIKSALSDGQWVICSNGYLDEDVLIYTLNILQTEKHIDTNFRLWLITEPENLLTSRILESSIRVILGYSNSLKHNIRSIYEEMENKDLESCNHPSFKPLVYITSLFHSIIQERNKYGKIGWNSVYDFGLQDFLIAVETLKGQLKSSIESKHDPIPWKSLKFLIGKIVYGGYILDEYDTRIVSTYLEEFFNDFLFNTYQSFYFYYDGKSTYEVLPGGSKDDYLTYIDNMPVLNDISILGLQVHNELHYNKKNMEHFMGHLAVMQEGTGKKTCLYEEDVVRDITEKLMNIIPLPYETSKIKNSNSQNKYAEPVLFVLLHEVDLFNILIKTMNDSLTDVQNALKGKIKMEESIQMMMTELYNGDIPYVWKKVAPKTCSTLSKWTEHFIKRKEQYDLWSIKGEIPVVWLGGLHAPKSFLISLLQIASKRKGWLLENLTLHTSITNITDFGMLQDPVKIGCYVRGVYLEGATWDSEHEQIIPLSSKKNILDTLPTLFLLPCDKFQQTRKDNIKIPVYYSPLKNGPMNGSIFEANVSSSIHESQWILQGVCMLLNKD